MDSASNRLIAANNIPHPASILWVLSVNLVFAYWFKAIVKAAETRKRKARSPVQKMSGLPITISLPSIYLTTVTVPATVPWMPQEYS